MTKEFDTAKGAFILVAAIIAAQMLVTTIVVMGCFIGKFENLLDVTECKGVADFMKETFQMSFTAAIAFAGGRMSAPSVPTPKLPDKEG